MLSNPDLLEDAPKFIKPIRHKHLHFSARYNGKYNGLGHNPRRTLFKNQRKRYVFNG